MSFMDTVNPSFPVILKSNLFSKFEGSTSFIFAWGLFHAYIIRHFCNLIFELLEKKVYTSYKSALAPPLASSQGGLAVADKPFNMRCVNITCLV